MTRASEESPADGNHYRHWHALRADEALSAIESDAEGGLPPDEVARRLGRFGPNALPEAKSRSLLSVFLGQFKSPLIYLLFAAAGIALALGHVSDAGVIFTVVLLNALIGAFQEGRAERALEALRKLGSHPMSYVFAFIASGIVVVLAGTALARYADAIAEVTQLGRLWIGWVLLAGATVVLMSLGLAAIVYRAKRRFAMLEPSSVLMRVAYGLGMWLLYRHSAGVGS